MGFFLKIGSPMYFLIKCRSVLYLSIYKNNNVVSNLCLLLLSYILETFIYIIKTSHMLLTYKSKCLSEVGKESPGCFCLTGKEDPGDCVQKLAKILRANLIITCSFLF